MTSSVTIKLRLTFHSSVKRVAFVSGKVYYDMIKERAQRKTDAIAFIRVEVSKSNNVVSATSQLICISSTFRSSAHFHAMH
jgi:2-oxoglutarate dehydrogenase complex dehydrogenase (E1) component-like enzyme